MFVTIVKLAIKISAVVLIGLLSAFVLDTALSYPASSYPRWKGPYDCSYMRTGMSLEDALNAIETRGVPIGEGYTDNQLRVNHEARVCIADFGPSSHRIVRVTYSNPPYDE